MDTLPAPSAGPDPDAGRRMPELGIITDLTHADTARRAGADYVEPTIVGNVLIDLGEGRWALNPEATGGDLAPSSAILFPADVRTSDPAFPTAAVEDYLHQVMPAVRRVSRPGAFVVLGSGASRTSPDGVDREQALERLALSIAAAHAIAAEHELDVLLEPLHRGETDLVNSLAEAVAFLDAHGLQKVRVVADLFHIMREGESFDVVREHVGRVGHVHVADTDRLPPGQGDWPIGPFLRTLREAGYDGHVSIECHWQDFAAEVGPALAAVRAADPALR